MILDSMTIEEQVAEHIRLMCAQAAAANRGLFSPNPRIYFTLQQRGLKCGNTYFEVLESYRSLDGLKAGILECLQAGPKYTDICSDVEITVRSKLTSFWYWRWTFSIPRRKSVDLSQKADEFEKAWNEYFKEYKTQYREKVLQSEYMSSDLDRYYPDVEII